MTDETLSSFQNKELFYLKKIQSDFDLQLVVISHITTVH